MTSPASNPLGSSGISEAQANVLVSIYQRAATRLREIVLHPGGSAASQAYLRARAQHQLAQVESIVADLKRGTAYWIGDRQGTDGATVPGPVTSAVRGGIALGNQQAAALGIDAASSLGLIDRRTIEIFAHDIALNLNTAADSMGTTATRILRATQQHGLSEADINRVLAGGVIDGAPAATIRTLREDLRSVHGDEVEVIDKNGDPIHYDVGYYARMVVATRTRDAAVRARHGRLQELGLDLVAIIGRKSSSFCTAFLGQVFSLSGKSKKYPAYRTLPGGGPPFHPHCSKGTRPFLDDAASKSELDDADGLDDADHLLGKTPTEAQRLFKDLQIKQQIEARYPGNPAVRVPLNKLSPRQAAQAAAKN